MPNNKQRLRGALHQETVWVLAGKMITAQHCAFAMLHAIFSGITYMFGHFPVSIYMLHISPFYL
jgi:hypothetical protein